MRKGWGRERLEKKLELEAEAERDDGVKLERRQVVAVLLLLRLQVGLEARVRGGVNRIDAGDARGRSAGRAREVHGHRRRALEGRARFEVDAEAMMADEVAETKRDGGRGFIETERRGAGDGIGRIAVIGGAVERETVAAGDGEVARGMIVVVEKRAAADVQRADQEVIHVALDGAQEEAGVSAEAVGVDRPAVAEIVEAAADVEFMRDVCGHFDARAESGNLDAHAEMRSDRRSGRRRQRRLRRQRKRRAAGVEIGVKRIGRIWRDAQEQRRGLGRALRRVLRRDGDAASAACATGLGETIGWEQDDAPEKQCCGE